MQHASGVTELPSRFENVPYLIGRWGPARHLQEALLQPFSIKYNDLLQ